MISLITELTDAKGIRASHGLVFFDRECRICTSLARRSRRLLAKRGFALAALQDPRAADFLNLPPGELLREMRVATADGKVFGGAGAIVYLAGQIWWTWPLAAAARVPGAMRFLDYAYRRFADHRSCISGSCAIPEERGHTV